MKAGLYFILQDKLYPEKSKIRKATWRITHLDRVRYKTKLRVRAYRKRLKEKSCKQ